MEKLKRLANQDQMLLKELLRNPTLPIMVSCDVDQFDEGDRWILGVPKGVCVVYVAIKGGKWYEADVLGDIVVAELYAVKEHRSLCEDEFNELVEEELSKYPFVKAISLRIG